MSGLLGIVYCPLTTPPSPLPPPNIPFQPAAPYMLTLCSGLILSSTSTRSPPPSYPSTRLPFRLHLPHPTIQMQFLCKINQETDGNTLYTSVRSCVFVTPCQVLSWLLYLFICIHPLKPCFNCVSTKHALISGPGRSSPS